MLKFCTTFYALLLILCLAVAIQRSEANPVDGATLDVAEGRQGADAGTALKRTARRAWYRRHRYYVSLASKL